MTEEVRPVPVQQVDPSPYQPRLRFNTEALEELAASILQHGLIQPIIVRPAGDRFELIAGERRLRAARLLGRDEIPAIVRPYRDEEVLEAALIENLQREEISVVDEARAYRRLTEEFGYTQARIGERTGKSRVAVANRVRLLQLPDAVLDHLDRGALTEGHARALLGLPYPSLQVELADWVLRDYPSVREVERKVRSLAARPGPPRAGDTTSQPAGSDPNVAALEDRLRERFGTRVSLTYRSGAGTLSLEFYSEDDLWRILELLGVSG